jgi:hypothetical protein
MNTRGLISPKGELFAYVAGGQLYTLEGELSGRLTAEHILDLAGNPRWRRIGDAIYSLDGSESIGYLGAERWEEE